MNTSSILQRTESYLNIQLTRAGPLEGGRTAGPFITISREAGTGGAELGRALVAALLRPDSERPWMLYGGNLIDEMLRSHGLPSRIARFLPEDRISQVDASIGEIVGLHPDLWELIGKTNALIRQLASTGGAILLGRGANFATAGIPRGLHIRLIAPAAHRAARVARLQGIERHIAVAQNARRDAARRRYVRATFGTDIADPTAYDLVLNVARLPFEETVAMIAGLVSDSRAAASRSRP